MALESQVASAGLDLNHHYYELIVTIAFGAAHALRSQHDFWASWNEGMYGFQFDFQTGLNSFSWLDIRINKCSYVPKRSAIFYAILGRKLRIFTSKRKIFFTLKRQ
jgi:hypothetical protein